MSHNLGRLLPDGRTFTDSGGLTFVPGDARFVIFHFDNVSLSDGARLTVELGYDTDVFTADSGPDFWSRPANGAAGPIAIRITGGPGSARLREFGRGEPTSTGTPPQPCGSRTNPDPFFHTDPYQEPTYETRLMCTPGFAWQNAARSLPAIPDAVRQRVAAATGIIVVIHDGHVSSCTGTLIAGDLFLTARHCLNDPTGEDVRSGSVSFEYQTDADGRRPAGHTGRFFKVLGEVVSGTPPTGSQPSSSVDWVVVRLNAPPGALPPPLEMRAADLLTGETIFTMHHPNGATKKTQAGTHSGGVSITGFDYAGGSSGSALFDAAGRLVRGPLSIGGSCFAPGACSVVYTPLAPIKAAIANPPPPPAPLDVMIVFDRSGSMAGAAPPAGRAKLDEAQDAAALFVRLVREGAGDRLGLVTFSTMTDFVRLPQLAAAAKPVLAGPPPFTGGDIGGITPGGLTSIGAGVGNAILAFGSGGGNGRAILLLSDGLQNTPPMIEEIEGFLGAIRLCVVGFGSDAEIDGPLLSRIARAHGGDFTRAIDGLSLRKFFGLCFGNIFEAGALGDPDHVLPAGRRESDPHAFTVCGEERVTLVLGWDSPATPLRANVRTPAGKPINEKLVEVERGRTWAFWRIPLPHNGERDGTWQFTVSREPIIGAAAAAAPGDTRYFYLIVADGGPKLTYLGGQRRVYTGDVIDPLVGLHYPNGTTPKATVQLTITAPRVALGQLVAAAGLRPPATDGDAVGAFRATLQAIAREAGGALPIPMETVTVPLFDDGGHDDGAMEPDGVYNNRLTDLTRAEGTYEFRAVATFGEGCVATREAHWSIHVEPGIDPGCTTVTLVDETGGPGGRRRGRLVIRPCDLYGNPLGPGRGDSFTVAPWPGVQIDGGVRDEGDGGYSVPVSWDPAMVGEPGVLVQQPDRPGVPVSPSGGAPGRPCRDCDDAAEKLLDCLGLKDADVKRVRVKRVKVAFDLGGKKRRKKKGKKKRDC